MHKRRNSSGACSLSALVVMSVLPPLAFCFPSDFPPATATTHRIVLSCLSKTFHDTVICFATVWQHWRSFRHAGFF
ncbi:hypothetical protein GE09DRAFT_1080926 [Coniochaeta sp. 2T2.1]|nr:hypothetical protein GE09DRAFT_1080926 [Coniochaeta sp. 2T2.1]